jgi:hypothetical protein
MPYLTYFELKSGSTGVKPIEWDALMSEIDSQLGVAPGTNARFPVWLDEIESKINDTLRKRYTVPFADPVPNAVKAWCRALFVEKYAIERVIPGSTEAQDTGVYMLAKLARDEMERAADANEPAHPELPLRADLPSSSGVTLGGPVVIDYLTPAGYWDAVARRRL